MLTNPRQISNTVLIKENKILRFGTKSESRPNRNKFWGKSKLFENIIFLKVKKGKFS